MRIDHSTGHIDVTVDGGKIIITVSQQIVDPKFATAYLTLELNRSQTYRLEQALSVARLLGGDRAP